MIQHGFELIQEQWVPELRCNARYFAHCRTGARLLSIETDDINKVFGISFRTPVPNSTGVPHILEHAVLCGSAKYPVKKPFLELLRSSLYTFLNAFTGQDRTVYPIASLNLKSFYNLVDVYLDAVFHPLLSRETFEQEGWRFDLESDEAPLQFKGVVYNEMKGAQSSPMSLLMRASLNSLFVDHPYAYDSGGVPSTILDLTWENLKAFHARHYHPSNAHIFFYGDDDPERRLTLLNDVFQTYTYRPVDTRIPLWGGEVGHRHQELRFTPTDAGSDKGFITCNWLMPDIPDRAERILLSMASSCLLGSPSAPLYKTLIDRGLGEDVIAAGVSFNQRQPTFTVGMTGVEPARFSEVETTVSSTLAELVQTGFADDLIQAVLNSTEFALREFSNTSFPKGLALMMNALPAAMYDQRLGTTTLGFRELLHQAKTQIRGNKQVLQDVLERYLLHNTHRSTVTLRPDMQVEQTARQEEQARLSAYAQTLCPEDRSQLVARSAWLQQYQAEPDSPEALATLPTLALSDIERETREYPCQEQDLEGIPLLSHDIFTHEIVYVNLLFNLHVLPQRYLPYLDLFESVLRQNGTTKEDFVTFSRRIAGTTGGMGVSDLIMDQFDATTSAAYLVVSAKCLEDQCADMASLLTDMLVHAQLDNKSRVQQLLLQARTQLETALIPAGHAFVGTRLMANTTEVEWLDELTDGISALLWIRRITDDFEQQWPDILAALEEMRSLLLQSGNLLISITSPEKDQVPLRTELKRVLEALPHRSVQLQHWTPESAPEHEALIVPMPVNCVGRRYDLATAGYAYHGAINVLTRLINTSWLWSKVREQGGAYGCSASYNRFSGHLSFVSYRDPNIGETLQTYDATANFLAQLEMAPDELVKLIIGTFGAITHDLQPKAQGKAALSRYLTGSTRELRQQHRDEILATETKHLQQISTYMAEATREANNVVMGSESAIQEAVTNFGLDFRSRLVL